MDFKIGIVAVGLARQQALQPALGGFVLQFDKRRFGLGENRLIALSLGEFDQLQRIGELAFDAAIAFDTAIEARAFAQQSLRPGRVIPEIRVFNQFFQFGEPFDRPIPVKDASSAGSTSVESRLPSLLFQRAFTTSLDRNYFNGD